MIMDFQDVDFGYRMVHTPNSLCKFSSAKKEIYWSGLECCLFCAGETNCELQNCSQMKVLFIVRTVYDGIELFLWHLIVLAV